MLKQQLPERKTTVSPPPKSVEPSSPIVPPVPVESEPMTDEAFCDAWDKDCEGDDGDHVGVWDSLLSPIDLFRGAKKTIPRD